MITIAETMDIDVPVGTAHAAWNSYITGLIVGSNGRLAPPDAAVPWRRTERDADGGAVQFAERDSESTRVTLALEFEPSTEEESDAKRMEDLRRRIGADLHQFKAYAEAHKTRLCEAS